MRSMVLVLLAACASSAQPLAVAPAAKQPAAPATVDPGLAPPEPTLRLPRNFLPTRYAARLAIDPARAGFDGAIAITGEVAVSSAVIWLHGRGLAIRRALASRGGHERQLAVTPHGDDLLELRSVEPLEPGEWTVALDYTGEYDELTATGVFKQTVRDAAYVYTKFEPVYARRAFPCFDEPDSKVPWQLTLDVPARLVAVGNTPIVREQALDGEHRRVEFAPTRPLPSYLVAFGVGPFDIVDAGKTKTGTPVRVITMKDRAPEAAWAARTTPRILELLEQLFGSRYPYDKLDLLAVPVTERFVAMENAGLVTFTRSLILLDPRHAAKRGEYAWVLYAAHELAHQWLGDLVTTAWWDDLWLNEGLATWAEHKIVAGFEPAWREELSVVSERGSALGDDELVSAREIRQPIATPADILDAFDGITYDKGAAVLTMFEGYVGRDAFLAGVRDYLAKHAFGSATSSDLTAAIGRAAGKDVSAAFATFLDRPGAPELTATLVCDAGVPPRLALSQRRYVPPGSLAPPDDRPWLVPVCVAFDRDGARGEACTLLDAAAGSLALDTRRCPRWVMPNVDGRGYYRTSYTAAEVAALHAAWPELRPTERRAALFDIGDAAMAGKLPLQLGLSLAPRLDPADQFSVRAALSIPLGVEDAVPDGLRHRYEAWLRDRFGPAARKVGLLPEASDSLDIESARVRLLNAAGAIGGDPVLVTRAIKLADHWRDLPQATRGSVLAIAAHASRAVFERLLAAMYTEPDGVRRGEIIGALRSTPDVERQREALALTLDPRLDAGETRSIFFDGAFEANRVAAQQFFQAHQDVLMKRIPSETAISLAYVFTASCSPQRRDEIARYVTDTFGALPGGARTVRQAIEGMDECIARRTLIEPELRDWLDGESRGHAIAPTVP